MANRMIKDTIRTSKSVNNMSDFQFRLWIYLITYVDDYGRGSADPELLKGFVFPRRKGVTESSIKQALADLANSGSVTLYEVDGEPYFCFPNWGDHQRIQTKRSKFPAPDGAVQDSTVTHGDSRKSTVTHGDSPPETETKPNFKTETETKDSGGGGDDARTQEAVDEFCSSRGLTLSGFVAMTPELRRDIQTLTDAIFRRFTTRTATEQDQVQVFLLAWDTDRNGGVTFNANRRDLLLYAFEASVNAGKAGDWSYIRGVLLRLRDRGIQTLAQAEDYDWDRA